jgi:aspartyl-tRNA(Asn)/glutamyl-tRNA(Gln) amidotransferase subunit C
MKITIEEVRETAELARLELGDDELHRLAHELDAILGYMDRLAAVDVSGVEPMTHAVAVECPLAADTPGPQLAPEVALRDAPARADDQFQVPRIIGEAT